MKGTKAKTQVRYKCEKSKQAIMTNSSLSRLQTHESDHKHKIAFLNAFYHKNEEKMKVNLTHRYNRG